MKKILVAVLVVLTLLLISCGDRGELEHTVRHSLRDPDSAKFGWYAVYKDVACIVVNSKNGFGGYTGNQTWILSKSSSSNWNWEVDDYKRTSGYCSRQTLVEYFYKEDAVPKRD